MLDSVDLGEEARPKIRSIRQSVVALSICKDSMFSSQSLRRRRICSPDRRQPKTRFWLSAGLGKLRQHHHLTSSSLSCQAPPPHPLPPSIPSTEEHGEKVGNHTSPICSTHATRRRQSTEIPVEVEVARRRNRPLTAHGTARPIFGSNLNSSFPAPTPVHPTLPYRLTCTLHLFTAYVDRSLPDHLRLRILSAEGTTSWRKANASSIIDTALARLWEAILQHHHRTRTRNRHSQLITTGVPRRWYGPARYHLCLGYDYSSTSILTGSFPEAEPSPSPTPTKQVRRPQLLPSIRKPPRGLRHREERAACLRHGHVRTPWVWVSSVRRTARRAEPRTLPYQTIWTFIVHAYPGHQSHSLWDV